MIPKVFISCSDKRDSASIVFETLRTGFPSAEIEVGVAGGSHGKLGLMKSLGCKVHFYPYMYHPDWIRARVNGYDGPMVLLDGDVIFHEKAEHWEFEKMLAGYCVPMIWNDFSKCIAFPRLHTSFLWIKDTKELRRQIIDAYPESRQDFGEYCPFDPFSPRVMFIHGKPHYWDTCCGLYQALGGTHFNEKQKAAYTHLHSASFYDVMIERLENKKGFEYLHREAYKEKEMMKLYQKSVENYYRERHDKAMSTVTWM